MAVDRIDKVVMGSSKGQAAGDLGQVLLCSGVFAKVRSLGRDVWAKDHG